MKAMIADYMERGFLENIVDMFKNDMGLYVMVGDLMKDERMRVRLGAAALVEILAKEDADHIVSSIPSISSLLRDESPTIRGDAAYVLGMIGHEEAMPYLVETLSDQNADVREIAREAIEDIKRRGA